MKYAIVIEPAVDGTFGAYVPDLPGVGVTAATATEARQLLREAVALHLAGLREDGLPVPPPSVQIDYVDVPAAA